MTTPSELQNSLYSFLKLVSSGTRLSL